MNFLIAVLVAIATIGSSLTQAITPQFLEYKRLYKSGHALDTSDIVQDSLWVGKQANKNSQVEGTFAYVRVTSPSQFYFRKEWDRKPFHPTAFMEMPKSQIESIVKKYLIKDKNYYDPSGLLIRTRPAYNDEKTDQTVNCVTVVSPSSSVLSCDYYFREAVIEEKKVMLRRTICTAPPGRSCGDKFGQIYGPGEDMSYGYFDTQLEANDL